MRILVFTTLAVGLAAAAWFFTRPELTPDPTGKGEAKELSELPTVVTEMVEAKEEVAPQQARVQSLLENGDFLAFEELVELYKSWAGRAELEPLRREILEAIVALEDGQRVVGFLLDAVSTDPTPRQEDPHWDYAVERLVPHWRSEAAFSLGRNLLVTARFEKTQELLAASLVARTISEPAGELPEPARLGLASDLIDLHFRTASKSLQELIREQLRELGEGELVRMLTEGDAHAGEPPSLEEVESEDQVVRDLVEAACREDVTLEAFASTVESLRRLRPGALREVAGRASILKSSSQAQELLREAMKP